MVLDGFTHVQQISHWPWKRPSAMSNTRKKWSQMQAEVGRRESDTWFNVVGHATTQLETILIHTDHTAFIQLCDGDIQKQYHHPLGH